MGTPASLIRCRWVQTMTTGDEAVGDAGASGQPREWHLPAAGDFRQLVERLPLIAYVDAPLAISPSLYVSPADDPDPRLHAGGLGVRP